PLQTSPVGVGATGSALVMALTVPEAHDGQTVILFVAGWRPRCCPGRRFMPDTAGRGHWTMSAATAWLVAAAGYLALEAVAACGTWPNYSYTRDYISDLGIPSASPFAYLMNTAFCLQGTLFLLGAILVV